MSHTPGPWKVEQIVTTRATQAGQIEYHVPVICAAAFAEDMLVPTIARLAFTDGGRDVQLANAALIASAPLLAERVRILREVANQVVLEDEQNPGRIPSDIVTGACAALKATKEGA